MTDSKFLCAIGGELFLNTPGEDEPVPVGECLVCGHILPFAVWPSGHHVGVCEGCRDAGAVRRGSCSDERGCLCATAKATP